MDKLAFGLGGAQSFADHSTNAQVVRLHRAAMAAHIKLASYLIVGPPLPDDHEVMVAMRDLSAALVEGVPVGGEYDPSGDWVACAEMPRG